MSTPIEIPDDVPPVGAVAGKRVVVTGAGRGLGHVIAAAFSNAGAKVALVARTESELSLVAESLAAETMVCVGDVRDPDFNDSVACRVAEQWGGLDAWIANAGISPVVCNAERLEPSAWREIIDVNLTGVFFGARSAARAMKSGGTIIVTGSVLGERARQGLSAYVASKAGVVGLVRVMALELGPAGITVNAVAPGWFDSPMASGFMSSPQLNEEIIGHTALRRWGRSGDLPGIYLFLASDAARFITGTVVTVDGGYLLV